MKILRAITRRGFNVGPAGYFTVLRPTIWFAASRLPDSPYGVGRYKEIAEPKSDQEALNRAGSQGNAIQWQMVDLSRRDRHLIRAAFIVLGAIAITFSLLLWIMHPNFR